MSCLWEQEALDLLKEQDLIQEHLKDFTSNLETQDNTGEGGGLGFKFFSFLLNILHSFLRCSNSSIVTRGKKWRHEKLMLYIFNYIYGSLLGSY